MLVVSLGLLGVAIYYRVLTDMDLGERAVMEALVALSFGASLISIFARLGGGIFTKGADVGADLVGKVEAGIPEDDPRNPAVIADNVGDNVGDCAGMAADLFETYAVTLVATMLLAAIYGLGEAALIYPIAIGAVCIITSVSARSLSVLVQPTTLWARCTRLHRHGGSFCRCDLLCHPAGFADGAMNYFICAIVGLLVTGALVWITEYYTSTEFRPVRTVAKASKPATART